MLGSITRYQEPVKSPIPSRSLVFSFATGSVNCIILQSQSPPLGQFPVVSRSTEILGSPLEVSVMSNTHVMKRLSKEVLFPARKCSLLTISETQLSSECLTATLALPCASSQLFSKVCASKFVQRCSTIP